MTQNKFQWTLGGYVAGLIHIVLPYAVAAIAAPIIIPIYSYHKVKNLFTVKHSRGMVRPTKM